MGGTHSREDLELSESESDSETQSPQNSGDSGAFSDRKDPETPSSVDDIDAKLKSLKLKYQGNSTNVQNGVKLYLHMGGNTPNSKWVVSDKFTSYLFVKTSRIEEDEEEEDGDEEIKVKDSWWVLKIGSRIRVKVSVEMQLKSLGDQLRVDLVANGVWAVKFFRKEDYEVFLGKYEECLFENTYGVEFNEGNKVKVYGKDFLGWADPEKADDSVWEDAEESFEKSPGFVTPVRGRQDLNEEFEDVANGGSIQSLALGALDNSFLVGDVGIQVVRNFNHGISGKGVCVNYEEGRGSVARSTPRKAILMKAETNMLLMSPVVEGKPHTRGLHQFDIETGRVVTEWKFEKDGTDITMRDVTNDSKGAQIEQGSTFLGLDDNRLCRWDMRDRHGMVQDLTEANTPVLNWAQGHQFSRGTNFQCFATTGDGSIVVGSLDGKIRLYSNSSMRQAKTAFPGLGMPITHVDVTYDGKWILGTTDTYLILICTMFTDKDGKSKTGFSGRMGNRISAPRLLKLTPLDSHMAGLNNKFREAQFSWVNITFWILYIIQLLPISCFACLRLNVVASMWLCAF